MKKASTFITILIIALMVSMQAAGCGTQGAAGETAEAAPAVTGEAAPVKEEELSPEGTPEDAAGEMEPSPALAEEDDGESGDADGEQDVTPNGEIMILFTSDVHCGVEQGFGYVGLQQIRDTLDAQGYATILVDNGDAIQGEPIGMMSRGESIIRIMNAAQYDVATPGNHAFDYGVDRFTELTEQADFPYVSCNFSKEGELLLPPYTIIEAAGRKIAFVGITTPETLVSSTPAYFQNEKGEYIYDFMSGGQGQELYDAVQEAVDEARAAGAEYVYAMGHLGMNAVNEPWTYADVIAHTSGIDVFVDGHSHDTDRVVMKNKDGEEVVRQAPGTKLSCIGYSHISAEGQIEDTGIWSWPNDDAVPALLGLSNAVSEVVEEEMTILQERMDEVITTSDIAMTIFDPEEVDSSGNPIRMVRRAETNLGDFCADAFRDVSGADIALANGGGVRTDLDKGEITYGDILAVMPFNNELCLVEATGQQILDALEWGAQSVPDEFGSFLQVSGLTYEIDTTIPTPCQRDDLAMMTGIEGERRVKNVMVGDAPIDPAKTYTVCGSSYVMTGHGDGLTAFDEAKVLIERAWIDSEALIAYIDELDERYADPYGEGRITILE